MPVDPWLILPALTALTLAWSLRALRHRDRGRAAIRRRLFAEA